MPHVIALALAGAGLAAGYKWVSKKVSAHLEAERARAEAAQREAAGPKEMGSLEWDAETGVYKPQRGT